VSTPVLLAVIFVRVSQNSDLVKRSTLSTMKLPALFLPCCCLTLATPDKPTVTETLVQNFNAAWELQDIDVLYDMMAPDCVFRSPFQTHLTRDKIRDTVLKSNVPRIRDIHNCVEEQSKIAGDYASSVGRTDANLYNDDGSIARTIKMNYIFVFTRESGQDWKLQMLIYHEPRQD
jgi:ketosteroid isomerase-like protein